LFKSLLPKTSAAAAAAAAEMRGTTSQSHHHLHAFDNSRKKYFDSLQFNSGPFRETYWNLVVISLE
jgi:hypothetical protein